MSNQVQNKPSAAYWLSIIGGILGILFSLVLAALGALAFIALNALDYYDYSYGLDYSSSAFGWGASTLLGIGIWGIISSVLVIKFARKLNANPMEHTKWGLLIFIFSIIGVMGFIGAILAFIGGILALVYKPIPAGVPMQYSPQQPYYGPPPQPAAYQQPIATSCPQCGTQVQPGVRFCPNCGRQLN